jgi:SpoVK/Ycf46/Vps4 family AAA+-type ATPase
MKKLLRNKIIKYAITKIVLLFFLGKNNCGSISFIPEIDLNQKQQLFASLTLTTVGVIVSFSTIIHSFFLKDVIEGNKEKKELLKIITYASEPNNNKESNYYTTSQYNRLYNIIEKNNKLGKSDSILLFGSPGNGKTLSVKKAASEAKIPLFIIPSSFFLYKTKNLTTQFKILEEIVKKELHSIIFIDELDSIAPSRDKGNLDKEQREALSCLLLFIEKIKKDNVTIISATNKPNEIDHALLRPGRFGDHKIEYTNPKKKYIQELVNQNIAFPSVIKENRPLIINLVKKQLSQRESSFAECKKVIEEINYYLSQILTEQEAEEFLKKIKILDNNAQNIEVEKEDEGDNENLFYLLTKNNHTAAA